MGRLLGRSARLPRRRAAAIACVGLALGGGVAFASSGGFVSHDGTITACVKTNSGNIKLIQADDACGPSEVKVTWRDGSEISQYALRCPAGTEPAGETCFGARRTAASYYGALTTCSEQGQRLPTVAEMKLVFLGLGANPAFAEEENWLQDRESIERAFTLTLARAAGPTGESVVHVHRTRNIGPSTTRGFRCVTGRTNGPAPSATARQASPPKAVDVDER
jgi:hypothetical protein